MAIQKRNSGIDLFKMIAAFMIVCLHTLTQGGIMANLKDLTVKGEIFWLLETVFFVGVNCFAVISGYVGLNSSHKYSALFLFGCKWFFGRLFSMPDRSRLSLSGAGPLIIWGL